MRSVMDTHVAACAAAILADGYYPGTHAVSLVTKNTRTFGIRKLAALGIDVLRPDPFLLDQFTSSVQPSPKPSRRWEAPCVRPLHRKACWTDSRPTARA